MYFVILPVSEFRAPHSYITPIFIMLFPLRDRIKMQLLGGGAKTSGTTPAPSVWADVVVDQEFFKMVGSVPPVLVKVLSEIARCDLSPSVAYIPCSFQISHNCIYNWNSCLPIFPKLNFAKIRFCVPRLLWLLADGAKLMKDFCAIMKSPKLPEISDK